MGVGALITVNETVPGLEVLSPSYTVYVKESDPIKPVLGE